MSKTSRPTSPKIVFYQGDGGRSRIETGADDGTVWFTRRLLTERFQVAVPIIHEYLNNIFEVQTPATTIRRFRMVQADLRITLTYDVTHKQRKQDMS
jgi:hypothetical protein